MIKAAFFDIDGTLLSFVDHKMPESTKRALARLRERGVLCIVCSGRSRSFFPPCIEGAFDAYITLNGQACFDERGIYRSAAIDEDDVRAIVEQVRSGAYETLVCQGDRSFASALTPRVVEVGKNAGLVYDQDDIERALDAPVYQFCAMVGPEEEHIILDATTSVATTRWTNLFCDVVPREGGKAYGVAATLERYGIAPEEAVAFGDGENDLSMFDAVGTSVAMGNAWDLVKERATLVTDDVDSDGLWNACVRLGLV